MIHRLGKFLCSDECSKYLSVALGVAFEKVFANYSDNLKECNIISEVEFKTVTLEFASMFRNEINGVNGLNNLTRIFDGASFDFIKAI